MCSSSSSSGEPSLVERILAVPKSYIYIPDKGSLTHPSIFSSPSRNSETIYYICISVFRFPLKLAVSAFVAFLAIYHVRLDPLGLNAIAMVAFIVWFPIRRRCCWSSPWSPRCTSSVPALMKTSPTFYLASGSSCRRTGWRSCKL